MTPRRLGFYMPRANYLKVMGPLIDYLVTNRSTEFEPVVLLPGWKTSKPQLRFDVAALPAAWKGRLEVRTLPDVEALHDVVEEGSLSALFSVQPALSDIDATALRRLRRSSIERGVKWVALPDGFSQNGYFVTQARSLLDNWDLVCALGPHGIRYIEKHLTTLDRPTAAALRGRVAAVGYPEFDGLRRLDSNDAIRRKYGLPSDRPIVFVATAARTVPLSVNTWTARGLDARFRGEGWSAAGVVARAASIRYPRLVGYRQYLAAIRRFADANGAVVVAKTRAKHRDDAYVAQAVDYFVDDQSFYPFTTLELLRVARLYFGFSSNTVSEAVVSGVYAMSAMVAPAHTMQANPQWRDFHEAMTWGPDGLWRVPGVSDLIEGTTTTGAAALERFARSSLDDYRVDAEQSARVTRDFFSYPCNSSALVLEALAARWSVNPTT